MVFPAVLMWTFYRFGQPQPRICHEVKVTPYEHGAVSDLLQNTVPHPLNSLGTFGKITWPISGLSIYSTVYTEPCQTALS